MQRTTIPESEVRRLLEEWRDSPQARRLEEEGRAGHPIPDGTLQRFDAGQLAEEENRQIRSHLLCCTDCSRQLSALRAPWRAPWYVKILRGCPRALRHAAAALALLLRALCQAAGARVRQAILELSARQRPVYVGVVVLAMISVSVGLRECHNNQLRLADAQALHEAQRQIVVREAIIDSLGDLAQLQRQMASAPAYVVGAAVRQVHAVSLQAVAQGQTYSTPYFFVGEGPKNLEAIAEGLLWSKDLQAEYAAFLRHWTRLFADLVFANFGDQLVREGKVEDALLVFTYLGQKNPEDKEVLFALGELLKLTGQHEKAIAVYQAMIDRIDRQLAPDDPRPWHFAGWSYYQLGDCQSALAYYDQALAIAHRIAPLQPYPKVYYNKALCYEHPSLPGLPDAERERLYRENLQQALDLTLDAYQREGDDNPRIPFTLAILYAKKQEWEQVLKYLERAMQKEQTYHLRAWGDPAFALLRDDPSTPYHARFVALLDRYRPPALGRFGARLEATFDPTHFSE